MGTSSTYQQQDSVKSINLSNTLPNSNGLGNISRRTKPVSIINDTHREAQQVVPEKKTYTPEQIRIWKLRKENLQFCDSSAYLQGRHQMNFSTEKLQFSLVLPNRERNSHNTDWLTVVIFLGIIIIASIRYNYAKYIEHLFYSLFNYPTSARMFKERNYPATHASYRLQALFYITLPILIFQFFSVFSVFRWNTPGNDFIYFLIITGSIVLYYFGKKASYYLLGTLFEAQNETVEFLFNINNYNRILGLVLLPIVILTTFAPVKNSLFIVSFGLLCVFIFNILLLRRGFFILIKKQLPYVYMFLYLCTLEILPLLLIYKLVIR